MKRMIAVITLLCTALGLLTGCGAGDDEAVSVESVATITGLGPTGVVSGYAGKIVSGEMAEVQKDSDKTVLEVYVEEGDMVTEGDVLFSYDTEAMQLALDRLHLEKEGYQNTIAAAQAEITELEKQMASAKADQKLSYTLQIDTRKADIREAEYNIALKDTEIAAMESSMGQAEVAAPISGRVMSVGSADSSDASYDGGTGAFITIMDLSDYRVQGQINELNRAALTEGMRVLIRSRINSNEYWFGELESIDWENPSSGGGDQMYYDDSQGMTSSSNYPFYITLDNAEGLLLGQHVYILPDLGQLDGGTGLMLPAYYIVRDEFDTSGGYVWAASKKGKLEKRTVVLGVYDEGLDRYEITSGLDFSDYIAFPDDSLSAGRKVVYMDDSSFDNGADFLPADGGVPFDEDFDIVDGEDFGAEDFGAEEYSDEVDFGDEGLIPEGAVG